MDVLRIAIPEHHLFRAGLRERSTNDEGSLRRQLRRADSGALDGRRRLRVMSRSYRSIAYTSFNLPDSGVGISGPAGTPKHAWVYDENHARIKEVRTIVGGAQAGTRTTWALHPDNQGGLAFESEVNAPTSPSAANPAVTSNRHYLSAGGQAIGVLVTTGALPTLTPTQTAPPAWQTSTPAVKLEVWHKDHLGSIAATTDHNGALTARYAYDPFGKRRQSNGNYDAAGTLVVDWSPAVNAGTDRGYTGHEQLDDVGLVHMNGRVFDATLGVFLQADPVMQDPLNLQNYNRYGYCFNNPLSCTDPSGFSFWTKYRRAIIGIAVAIVAPQIAGWLLIEMGAGSAFVIAAGTDAFALANGIGASLTGLGNFTVAAVSGFASGAVATGSFEGGLQGAFTAGMFFGAGDLIGATGAFAGGEQITDKFAQAAVHGVVGCVTSQVGGGKCGAGAMSAAFSKFATVNGFVGEGAVAGTITSAVIGGTASALGGGTFANGATTAAFGYLFNELRHQSSRIQQGYADAHTMYAYGNGWIDAEGNPKPFDAAAARERLVGLTDAGGVVVSLGTAACVAFTPCAGGAVMAGTLVGAGLSITNSTLQGSLTSSVWDAAVDYVAGLVPRALKFWSQTAAEFVKKTDVMDNAKKYTDAPFKN